LLRREGSARPKVAGRIRFDAANLAAATRAIEKEIAKRCEEEDGWSLGLLKPLTPNAPGTHRYRAVFAVWEAEGDRFQRRDVHEMDVWAADAGTARRIAHQEIQQVEAYQPSWRIRRVRREA
jgi:hypothetical protein